jgi:hypothetical protein
MRRSGLREVDCALISREPQNSKSKGIVVPTLVPKTYHPIRSIPIRSIPIRSGKSQFKLILPCPCTYGCFGGVFGSVTSSPNVTLVSEPNRL